MNFKETGMEGTCEDQKKDETTKTKQNGNTRYKGTG